MFHVKHFVDVKMCVHWHTYNDCSGLDRAFTVALAGLQVFDNNLLLFHPSPTPHYRSHF